MNNKTLAVGSIIFCLLIAALLTRNGGIAWMMLPFLAYLGVGILQTPALDRIRFSAERTLQQGRLNGNAFVDVNLGVQNQALEAVHLFIQEIVQAGMEITDRRRIDKDGVTAPNSRAACDCRRSSYQVW